MKALSLLSLLLIFACNQKNAGDSNSASKADDSIVDVKVGSDQDIHGCKGSASYRWSEVKGECVRIFEVGTRLKAVRDSANTKPPAYVIIEGNQAEVFFQTENSLVLKRKNGNFSNGEWQLTYASGYNEKGVFTEHPMYMLSKNGDILFFSFGKPAQ